MQPVETTDDDVQSARSPDLSRRSSRSPVSVALLAGMACVPIVVAAGFLMDRRDAAPIPGDISTLALRGVLDGNVGTHNDVSTRAGY